MTALAHDQYVRVGPSRVRVRITGEGHPLLLIMGIGGNLDMWDPLLPHLPGRQVITFDFPGTGWSDRSPLPPAMGMNALLVRRLVSKLGYRRLDVAGYSWGGLLAQHLAIQHPRMVRRLVLAATTFGLGGRLAAPRVLAQMMTPRRYYSPTYFTKVAPDLYGGRYRTGHAPAGDDARRRSARPPSIIGYGSQLAAVQGYSTAPLLPFVMAPTLIISGDDDPLIPTVNARIMARLIRRSSLHIVPGAGHLVLLDSPEIAGPIITDFLDS